MAFFIFIFWNFPTNFGGKSGGAGTGVSFGGRGACNQILMSGSNLFSLSL
jgi:hypothetical protein